MFRLSALADGYTGDMNPGNADLMAVSMEPDPTIEAYKRDVDRTLIREALRLTPSERVEKMIAAAQFADAVRRSRVVTTP